MIPTIYHNISTDDLIAKIHNIILHRGEDKVCVVVDPDEAREVINEAINRLQHWSDIFKNLCLYYAKDIPSRAQAQETVQ